MKNARCTSIVSGCTLLLALTGVSHAHTAKAGHTAKHHAVKAKISAAAARAAALKKYPGTVVGKIALENEEGRWQYAVNVRSGKKLREVMVGAYNGKIENVELTTPAEEAAEAKAEAKGAASKEAAEEKSEGKNAKEKGEKGEKDEADEKEGDKK